MGARYDQLRQLLINSIVQVCQQESFYIEELKVEGTLCLTSDGASVLVTQITERIGEKCESDSDQLPLLDMSRQQDQPVCTESDCQLETKETRLSPSRLPGEAAKKLEQLRKGGSVHSFWKAQQKSPGGYKCPFCKNVYRFKHSLKDHLNKHIGRKPYLCKHCGMTFTHLASLCAHTRRQHSKQVSWDYKCPLCEECFFSLQSLKQHCTWRHRDSNWTQLLPQHGFFGSRESTKRNKVIAAEGNGAIEKEDTDSSNQMKPTELPQTNTQPSKSDDNTLNDVPADPVPEPRRPTTRSQAAASSAMASKGAEPQSQKKDDNRNKTFEKMEDEEEEMDEEEVETSGSSPMSRGGDSAGVELGQVGAPTVLPPALAAGMMAQASLGHMAMQMGGMAGLWPSMGAWFSQAQAAHVQHRTPPTPAPPTPTNQQPNSPIASVDQVAAVLGEVRKDVTTGKFPCPYCSKSYRYKHTLKDHLNNHTGMRPHVCDICGSSFIHLASLCAHIKRLHSNEHIGDFKCPACKQGFRKMASLKQHITWQHKEMQTSTMFDNLLESSQSEASSLSQDFPRPHGAFGRLEEHPLPPVSHVQGPFLATTLPQQHNQKFTFGPLQINQMALNMLSGAMLPKASKSPTEKPSPPPQTSQPSEQMETATTPQQPPDPTQEVQDKEPDQRPEPDKTEKEMKVIDDTDRDESPEHVPQFYRDWAQDMQNSGNTDGATAYLSPNGPSDDPEAELPNSTVIAQYFDEVNVTTPQGVFRYKCKLCEKMYRHRTSVYDHINTHLNKKPYVCRECGDAFAHHSSLFNHTKNKHS